MTAQRTGDVQWRRITVLIRADIFAHAEDQGIDISSECNLALAERLGIDYSQQKIPDSAPVRPVIIAAGPTGSAAGEHGLEKAQLRPVLNADDLTAPAHILKMKAGQEPEPRQVTEASAAQREHAGSVEPETVPKVPAAASRSSKKKTDKGLQKKGRDDLIRQFLAKKILRTDAGDPGGARIPKDEMYQLFVRFCRAHPGGQVPDKRSFAVALKNRFVVEEITDGGTPYWINVSLR
jgi:hypothetical protein